MEQQTNISSGRAVNLHRLGDNRAACDLFVRMTRLDPKARLSIEQARRHPALWGAETKLKMVCDWAKSWERGAALQQKLERHAAAVLAKHSEFGEQMRGDMLTLHGALGDLAGPVRVGRAVGNGDAGTALTFLEYDVDNRLLDDVSHLFRSIGVRRRLQRRENRLGNAIRTLTQCHDVSSHCSLFRVSLVRPALTSRTPFCRDFPDDHLRSPPA